MVEKLASVIGKKIALHKVRFILITSEKKSLILLSMGAVILSLSEAFSIGMIVPVMEIFMNREVIHSSSVLQRVYRLVGSPATETFLKAIILTTVIIFILKSVYAVSINAMQQRIIGNIKNRIMKTLLESYLNKPYAFHVEHNSSVLLKNVINEVSSFSLSFLGSFISLVSEFLIVLGVLALLLAMYTNVTIFSVLLLGGVMIGINQLLRKRIQSYSEQRARYNALIFQRGTEALASVKEIQLYNSQSYFCDKFFRALRKYTGSVVSFSILSNVPRYMLEVIVFVMVMAGLLLCLASQKSATDLVPMMSLFALAFVRLLPCVNRMYLNINHIRFYRNSLDIVHEILRGGAQNGSYSDISEDRNDLLSDLEPITLKEAVFFFRGTDEPILQGINMVIHPCTTVAIVGETGAGKSTILDILLGFLAPTKGAVLYGDTRITGDNVRSYREKIGYVPQEIYLIDDTIEANIAFGIERTEIDHSRLAHVARIAQLEEMIAALPHGINTRVGEKGIKISGGQRQRIGLARALYRNPEILVLDEATSALDGHTESQVSRAIANLKNKMTVIIVAHRLSTIEHANSIYVLEKSRIVSEGTYEWLLKNSSAFRKIARQGDVVKKTEE